MISIETVSNGADNLELKLKGRLDTAGAPELEEHISKEIEGKKSLTVDFAELEYISSAGLRVLLAAQKKLGATGGVTVKNANEYIMEVFDVTGFTEILNIQ